MLNLGKIDPRKGFIYRNLYINKGFWKYFSQLFFYRIHINVELNNLD